MRLSEIINEFVEKYKGLKYDIEIKNYVLKFYHISEIYCESEGHLKEK